MATRLSPEADQHLVPDEVPDTPLELSVVCYLCGLSGKQHEFDRCQEIQLKRALGELLLVVSVKVAA